MAAKTLHAVVEQVRDDAPSIYTLFLKPEEKVSCEPGQFFFIYNEEAGKIHAKAYSLANAPEEEVLEFCIKRVENGFMSNRLYHLQKGERMKISGPYGFFTLHPVERDVVFVATGTGISALRPMMHRIFQEGTERQVTLIFGVRTQQDILYRKEWEKLERKNSNFRFLPVLSKEVWEGERGYVQDTLLRQWKDDERDFYICGLFPMVDAVKKLLLERGIDARRIHAERYV